MQLYRIRRTNNYLVHHGKKGQKWGVRNGPPYPLGTNKSFKATSFSAKLKSAKTYPLPPSEYRHVMHEITTHVTQEQDSYKPIISKAIGNFIYTFVNNYDGTFRVIGKIPNFNDEDYYDD